MEQIVRVQQLLQEDTALVLRVRESACSGDCHQCSGCGAPQQKLMVKAHNPIGAQPGDMVVVQTDTAPVLKAAVMLYVLPVVLFIGGYLAGEWLWQNGIWLSLAGLFLGFILVRAYDRHLSQKKVCYTITGYAEGSLPKNMKKGDNGS